MRLIFIIISFLLSVNCLASPAMSDHKFRIVFSAPPGTTLSGFNRAFFVSCDEGGSKSHFSESEIIPYLKSSDSRTGEQTFDEYTRGINVDLELLDCDTAFINQRVRVKIKAHYLREMKSRLMHPAPPGGPKSHQNFRVPKSLTKYFPKIKRVTAATIVQVDTTGEPQQAIAIADTPFSITVKRF